MLLLWGGSEVLIATLLRSECLMCLHLFGIPVATPLYEDNLLK